MNIQILINQQFVSNAPRVASAKEKPQSSEKRTQQNSQQSDFQESVRVSTSVSELVNTGFQTYLPPVQPALYQQAAAQDYIDAEFTNAEPAPSENKSSSSSSKQGYAAQSYANTASDAAFSKGQSLNKYF